MTDASQLCERVRWDLHDVEQRIMKHPWPAQLEAGDISRAGLQAFAGEQLHVIPSDRRSFELLARRFADDPAHGYLEGMAAGERAALRALGAFATAVGLDDQARRRYEPDPGCQAYPSFVARLARDGTAAEVAGAFLVNLTAWGRSCARMAAALPAAYGLTDDDCAFFTLFAGPTADLERASLQVIDTDLAQGVDPASIARAARLLQAYELLYWDSLPR